MNKIRDAKAKINEKIMKLEMEQLKLMDDIFTIDENGGTNNEKGGKLNDEIKELESLQEQK